ncbi:MAG: TlpA family protein disulfide reductase [Saprospiraceae bacterium]|nr:TlpA family protein disulfide reductase [Saprospiraceae bacterium]
MKLSLLFALCGIGFNILSGQNVQITAEFPFGIPLLQPDSVAVNTNDLLKRDKPTVLAFWLTTCRPCQMELASYAQHCADWQQEADFRLLAVSIDFPERWPQVVQMANEKGWPFPVYWDYSRAFKSVLPGGLNGLPQVFLFDANGTLVWHHKKYAPGDEQTLFSQIKNLTR